jgi:hypothetical protein
MLRYNISEPQKAASTKMPLPVPTDSVKLINSNPTLGLLGLNRLEHKQHHIIDVPLSHQDLPSSVSPLY